MSDPNWLYFRKLGSTIHDTWRREGFNRDAFPHVVERALSDSVPSEHVSFSDCVRFALLDDPLAFQPDANASFGQPPITVYWQHEFRIDLLFWIDSLLEIHEHAFSGAFHIMHGSSIHSEWNFKLGSCLGRHLALGDLIPGNIELLRRGDTRIIRPGKQFIHSTYHLDRPSISLVVRTNRESNTLPFFIYLRPGIAFAPEEVSVPTRRRSQILNMVARCRESYEFIDVTSEVLKRCKDPLEVFYVLLETMRYVKTSQERQMLLAAAENSHPALVSKAVLVLDQRLHDSAIATFRERVDGPDLRFFLATLIHGHTREVILNLIDSQYPALNALDLIEKWLLELSRRSILDLTLSDLHTQILSRILALQSTESIFRELITTLPSLNRRTIEETRYMLLSHKFLGRLFVMPTLQTESQSN